MKPAAKALLYNFLCFASLYILLYVLEGFIPNLNPWVRPAIAAIVASILAPKFQAVRTAEGEKVYMKWIFVKGVREIK